MKTLITLLPILLFTTIATAQDFKNTADGLYILIAEKVNMTKVDQETTSLTTKKDTFNGHEYVAELPDYYDRSLVQSKMRLFESQYSDIETLFPWESDGDGTLSISYKMETNGKIHAVIMITYLERRGDIYIGIYNTEGKGL